MKECDRYIQGLQPDWVCSECGLKYGARRPGLATWHLDECGVCGRKDIAVTEPRDFGYLNPEWRSKRAKNTTRSDGANQAR